MLTRLDNKYVVSADTIADLAPVLAAHFDILDIEGKRRFGYQTCYFDTPAMTSFHHHRQGRRQRSKVRTRHYLDANLCFVEVKLKTLRKVTVKKRLVHDPKTLEHLPAQALDFVEACHHAEYGRSAPDGYAAILKMKYKRMTLVAHDGGERLTIDSDLQFWTDDTAMQTAPDMYIIETKSRFGRGLGDQILRQNGHHPPGSCSKYCIGLAAVGAVPRINRFLPAFRRLLPHMTSGAFATG